MATALITHRKATSDGYSDLVRRDKGRRGADAGALCLSFLGIEQATRTSTRPPPLFTAAPCPYDKGVEGYGTLGK